MDPDYVTVRTDLVNARAAQRSAEFRLERARTEKIEADREYTRALMAFDAAQEKDKKDAISTAY